MAGLFFTLVILISVIGQIFAGEWKLDLSSAAAVIAGVGSSVDGIGAAAATANQIGPYVELYNGQTWTKSAVNGSLLLDVAITPSGTIGVATVHNIFISNDNGQTFNVANGIGGASQSASHWGNNKENLAFVGTWDDPNGKRKYAIEGVASSTDGGQTWSYSAPVPPGYPRYGAFPSENVWYVSSGIWGSTGKLSHANGEFPFSERFDFHKGGLQMTNNNKKPVKDYTGWFGAVSKTTDGGKTWEQIFQTDYFKDVYYFNAIHCSSETQCGVIAEGYDENGVQSAKIHMTWDGGVTWTETLKTDDYSMIGLRWVSDLEGWALGTDVLNRQDLYGQFYHTVDGGKTWELVQSLQNCFATDLEFVVTKGFAACSSSSGNSCSVAVYK